LVLGQGFATHGAVFAAGPVIVVGFAEASPVLTQSWIDGASWRHGATSLR